MNKLLPGFSPTSRSHPPSGMTTALASFPPAHGTWGPILDRTWVIQCRISDGDSVQVDVGDGTSELAQQWIELWAEIMRGWPKNTHPGDILPVGPELGSAPYSIHDLEGRELSNRWEQALK